MRCGPVSSGVSPNGVVTDRKGMMSDGSAMQPTVEASLDVVVDGTLMGWARDLERPNDAALLQLCLGERRIALFRADLFRPDLRDAGLGTGRHGFAVPVPSRVWERARRTGEVLTASAIGEPDRILFRLDNDERLEAPAWLRRFLAEALSEDAAASAPPSVPVRDAAPSYGPLFASASSTASPERTPSLFPYAEYVRQLRGMADRFMPELIGPDLDHFFRWYLQDYAAERAPLRAPLAAETIRWLNEPVVVGGLRHAPTRAMLWFLPESEHTLSALDDDEKHFDVLYWWACERAPALAVEDCLVPRGQMEALRRCPEHWAGQAFPLSRFMERALRRRPALSRLGPMHSLSARVTAYMLLLAEAIDEPGLLRFVPQPVLERLLGGAAPRLDALSADLIGTDPTRRPLTARTYRAHLVGHGFDLEALAFLSVDSGGNRCEAARLAAPPPVSPVDVQVIGPLGKASGVARATRQSRAALEATGLSVAALDCDFDNRQPEETSGRATTVADPVPARVNLFHLNADMLPLAYAYLPDMHQGAYTIGFFFWELNRPAECHRLALDLVDEVWVASEYNRRCFAAWTDKPVVNVGAALDLGPLPTPAAVTETRRRLCRAEPGDFVVLSSFDALSFVSRKNPLGLVRAFREAFPDDPTTRLVLKTHNTAAASDGFAGRVWAEVLRLAEVDPRVVVIDETLAFEEVMALTGAADCFASLHRSEGLGLGILEAMRLGVPVLCTAYGGNMDICDSETAWLVEADEVPVRPGDYAYASPDHRWAEPRHDSAVDALKSLRYQPAMRETRAIAARARVEERCSVAAAAERYASRLGEIMSEGLRRAGQSPLATGQDTPRPRRFALRRGS